MAAAKPTALPDLKLRKKITAAALAKEIAIQSEWVHGTRLAPDGRALLVGGYGTIEVVDLAEATTMRTRIPNVMDAMSAIEFLPGGERIVATCWTGELFVLAWPSLEVLATYAIATDRLHSLALMPDGLSAWVGGHDCKRTRVELATGKILATQSGEWGWVSDAVVGGNTLITSDAATVIRLCDAATGVERKQLKLGIASNMLVDGDEALIPNLYTATVNVVTGKVVQKLEGEHKLGASGAVFVEGGRTIVTVGHHDPLMTLWDRESGRALLTMKPLKKGGFAAVVVAGEHLVTVPLYEAPIQIWRTQVLIDSARATR